MDHQTRMGVNNMDVLSVLLLLAGEILAVAGLATGNWAEGAAYKHGLWSACTLGICVDDPAMYWESERLLDLTRALTVIGVVLAGIAFCVKAGKMASVSIPEELSVGVLGACILSGILIGAGLVVFFLNIDGDMGYSFVLIMIGAILIMGGGGVHHVASR